MPEKWQGIHNKEFRVNVMANVFICPIEDGTVKAHFDIAVETGYALESVLPRMNDGAQAEDLRRLCPDGRCYAWGVPDKDGNRSTWEVLSGDDLVLGYRNQSILSAATVLMKVDNPSLATALWGDHPEGPSRLMCFFAKPHVGEVPIVEQMEGYLDRTCARFTRLGPEKCETILRAFGSLENFVRLGLRYDFPFSFRHSE
jgi:hypothetical protein